MSLSASLANALSGLTAQSRASEVVSSNISNALTEGYGRREIELSTRWLSGSGSGVKVTGVSRRVDAYILGERRLADAALGDATARLAFAERAQQLTGLPNVAGSMTDILSRFETSLAEAISRPDAEMRLRAGVEAAKAVTAKFKAISDGLQELRMEADSRIEKEVNALQNGLARVKEINVAIRSHHSSDQDVNALLDQRQKVVDELSEIVPLRMARRDFGQVALYTSGGAVLLDGSMAQLDFQATGTITPDMTLASSALGDVMLNGRPARTGALDGGSLGAALAVRDNLAPTAQAELDALARDLVERFQNPAVDPSLTPTDAGLFTDAGSAFDPLNEVGLAARLEVNAQVDPTNGGAHWRLRDGINAATPGDVGTSAGLQRLYDALAHTRAPLSGALAGVARSAHGLLGDFVSNLNGSVSQAASTQAYQTANRDALHQIELRNGVDSDQEMQQLLLIEQAYAANARVVTTANEMLDILMGI